MELEKTYPQETEEKEEQVIEARKKGSEVQGRNVTDAKGRDFKIWGDQQCWYQCSICINAVPFSNPFHACQCINHAGVGRQTLMMLCLVGGTVYRRAQDLDLGRTGWNLAPSPTHVYIWWNIWNCFPVFQMGIIVPTKKVEYWWYMKYLCQMTHKAVFLYTFHLRLMIPHLTDKETENQSGYMMYHRSQDW